MTIDEVKNYLKTLNWVALEDLAHELRDVMGTKECPDIHTTMVQNLTDNYAGDSDFSFDRESQTLVSEGDSGYWVQGWFWKSMADDEGNDLEEDAEDDDPDHGEEEDDVQETAPPRVFSTLDELLDQAAEDGACQNGLNWTGRQGNLRVALINMPPSYRLWCLGKGYEQFEEHCPWGRIDTEEWTHLLAERPAYGFSSHCPWDKFTVDNWTEVLAHQPQFIDRCPQTLRDRIHPDTWLTLVEDQPELAKHCDWEKCRQSGSEPAWSRILRNAPQFAEQYPWSRLTEEAWENCKHLNPDWLKYRPVAAPPSESPSP